MIVKTIVPDGWPCSLNEATPGHFVTLEDPHLLCFKSEYRDEGGQVMAYNEVGERFHGDGQVQPVEMLLVNVED